MPVRPCITTKRMDNLKNVDVNFFPAWTRKSLTFTIDDGNVKWDRIFLDIVRPAGILGTFNLCSHLTSALTPEGYRDFYRGYEISNHVKYHPSTLTDGESYEIRDGFDPMSSLESPAGHNILYKTDVDGIYKYRRPGAAARPGGWWIKALADDYIEFVKAGKRELEQIFGEGSIRGFVWPGMRQNNSAVISYLKTCAEYYGLRKTGEILDTTRFSMPSDRMEWTYNATAPTLLSCMEKYDLLEDDGELKFFSFGVHSGDFETYGKWDDLREFASKYGNRPDDYYYASVGDIFAYEDATKKIKITDTEIQNPTDITLYVKVNGKKIALSPKSSLKI